MDPLGDLRIEECREAWQRGSNWIAVLDALHICQGNQWLVPAWLVEAIEGLLVNVVRGTPPRRRKGRHPAWRDQYRADLIDVVRAQEVERALEWGIPPQHACRMAAEYLAETQAGAGDTGKDDRLKAAADAMRKSYARVQTRRAEQPGRCYVGLGERHILEHLQSDSARSGPCPKCGVPSPISCSSRQAAVIEKYREKREPLADEISYSEDILTQLNAGASEHPRAKRVIEEYRAMIGRLRRATPEDTKTVPFAGPLQAWHVRALREIYRGRFRTTQRRAGAAISPHPEPKQEG